jgi:hypothetical protein
MEIFQIDWLCNLGRSLPVGPGASRGSFVKVAWPSESSHVTSACISVITKRNRFVNVAALHIHKYVKDWICKLPLSM